MAYILRIVYNVKILIVKVLVCFYDILGCWRCVWIEVLEVLIVRLVLLYRLVSLLSF